MPQCKSCNAEIIWIKTEAGKAMPLDAKPEKMFIHQVFVNGNGENKDQWLMRNCHKSHFAICPNANQHRKEKHESE